MRPLQLAAGWLVLCGLTAGGTYFGLMELDQQFGLQAKLSGPKQLASSSNSGTPVNPDPVKPSPNRSDPVQPAPDSGNPTRPVTPAPIRTDPPPSGQPPPTQRTPDPDPGSRQAPPSQDPPVRQDPPPLDPRPRGDVAGLQARYQRLYDEATEIASFYKARQNDLARMNQPLRADIRSRWSSMAAYLERAGQALKSGDSTAASKFLDQVEECIDYLEQSK